MTRSIRIIPYGGLGNRMFQYMFALALQEQVPEAIVSGALLDEWGLSSPVRPYQRATRYVVRRSDIPFDKLVRKIRRTPDIDVDLKRLNLRVAYFARHIDRCRRAFPAGAATGAGPDEIAINIRGAEIFSGPHPDYIPLPISFYEHVIAETGLSPVFVGQVDGNVYTAALRARFPKARFVSHGFGLGDFHFVRASHTIVPAVSTYSWLASWLSESARRIYLPAVGHYNPANRPDCDLLPRDDPRYVIYSTNLRTWKGTPQEVQKLIDTPLEAFGFRRGAPDPLWPGLRDAPMRSIVSLVRRHSLAVAWAPRFRALIPTGHR